MKIEVNTEFNIGDIVKYDNKKKYEVKEILLNGSSDCAGCDYVIARVNKGKVEVIHAYGSELILVKRGIITREVATEICERNRNDVCSSCELFDKRRKACKFNWWDHE